MDNTDCWINEFDFKSLTLPTGFVSPGPSSGYCSSEESYNQLKASNGSYDSKDRVFKQRQSESFLSHADAFGGASSLDLANFGTCGDFTEAENNVFELGNTPPNFDDLMDTLWNPINADFSSLDCIADSDISDTSHSSGILSLTSGCNDPGLTQFASAANGAQRYPSSGKPGWQKRAASPSKEEPYLVKKPSNPSLSAGNAAAISAESRNRLKRVFDFQRQVAGLADMMVGDEDEYILQFAPSGGNKVSHRVDESAASFMAAVSATPTTVAQGSALLGGVFSQRGTVPAPFKNCETRSLARVHGGAVSSPCGTLLRHSASVPNSVKSVAGNGAKDGREQRTGGSRLQNGGTGQGHPCARGDMKGGRANALALALDDHRYTLKPSHSPPAPRNARGRKTGAAGASSQNAPHPRRMSILEAFLRSTRPLDPNKGSNAALAAEGLAHLRIETDVDDDDEADDDDFRTSGTILKKLLTGEIDQSEVHRCEQRVIRERVSSCSALAEPVLADDFGLGAELLLSDSDASNLLCDELASGGLWMNTEIGDETFSSELDEILREQTRQDNLWLRHYIDCL